MATAAMLELMTAEQFSQRPDPGCPEELVHGRVVGMPPHDRRHGYVCGLAYYLLRRFVDEHELGRVMSNDSGVITQRDPDTVRGADVAYYDSPKARFRRVMDPKSQSLSSRFAR
jgi:Uma2 family endonuclease